MYDLIIWFGAAFKVILSFSPSLSLTLCFYFSIPSILCRTICGVESHNIASHRTEKRENETNNADARKSHKATSWLQKRWKHLKVDYVVFSLFLSHSLSLCSDQTLLPSTTKFALDYFIIWAFCAWHSKRLNHNINKCESYILETLFVSSLHRIVSCAVAAAYIYNMRREEEQRMLQYCVFWRNIFYICKHEGADEEEEVGWS